MFVLIGIGALLIYALLVFYIGWSGWSWMKPAVSLRFKFLYIISLVFIATSFILSRVFGGISFLGIVGAYWMAAFSLLLMILPIAHLTIWLTRLTSLPRHRVNKWIGSITLLSFFALIAYGSFNAYSPVVRTYDIQINKTVPSTDSLNIVMVSDMHFGLLSGKKHAERMVKEINALNPDIVLFPGDIIDDDLSIYLNKGIDRILTDVRAPYGVFASLGNHDKHDGKMQELIEALEQSNMHVLYDETIEINEEFFLVGRKDRTDSDRAEVAELMNGLDLSKPVILLDHQPYDLGIAQEQGVDLMVSGHTHRGQIAPGHLITRMIYENDWGHLQKGEFHSIVSSGYGFWGPPIRIGSRSELMQIKVTFDGA
ncbi:metallophosphoesterase [Paenibacillaceae bacterium]|nr:metallophosphoesterase [Paenibacillaceae bacterium]